MIRIIGVVAVTLASQLLIPPSGAATGSIGIPASLVSAASGRCLTVEGASTTAGARAIVYSCNGGANQRWTVTAAEELRVYDGTSVRCLDANQNGTTPGTRVQIWSCNGTAAQKWAWNANGTFTGRGSNLCLDVSGGGASPNGTPIVLWTCKFGAANQFWMQRAGGGLPAGVVFQDTGTLTGWNNYPQDPQKQGVLRTVTSPAFRGSGTAIEAQQTYISETGGYHSETVQHHTQIIGQDLYYGQAIYLPANWQWHNENVTFQQWSPEAPSGPWELMFVQNDELRLGGSGGHSGTIAKITDLRGTWIRIVTRIKFAGGTDGAFEVWVNGTKRMSLTNRSVLPKTAASVRWSSGIYCTGWRNDAPLGPWQLSIFHDHARVAASYSLAEPNNW
ncbi:Polysaccharide lyase [Lentzea albidocapillata subsp. violacea]|uniref:Polysaccharide lyase n=1 Tax=Lentzea albidocapillata subsp. violacea TaxID=128104 RepID=A0A1G8YDK9_9PSEU|nr:RICIN domain-containing protein [Lentzea albidocapillata]SDK00305.1 Polysaccharide lyase [Lentzea albidocapillata subsp. violacea]